MRVLVVKDLLKFYLKYKIYKPIGKAGGLYRKTPRWRTGQI